MTKCYFNLIVIYVNNFLYCVFCNRIFPNDFIVTIKFQCHFKTKHLEEKILKNLKHIGLKFLMATTIYNSLSN